jgi:hypothetical protein
MAGVRACIRGEGEAPMEVLLAACVLRDGKARVPAYAFRGDTSMTSIALPAGLTSLGEGAFAGCSSLTSIELPASFDDSTLRSAGVPPSAIHRFALTSAIENNSHVE